MLTEMSMSSLNSLCIHKIQHDGQDHKAGLKIIQLEYSLKLKIKRNDWLLADTCPQAANHCALF